MMLAMKLILEIQTKSHLAYRIFAGERVLVIESSYCIQMLGPVAHVCFGGKLVWDHVTKRRQGGCAQDGRERMMLSMKLILEIQTASRLAYHVFAGERTIQNGY